MECRNNDRYGMNLEKNERKKNNHDNQNEMKNDQCQQKLSKIYHSGKLVMTFFFENNKKKLLLLKFKVE